MVHDTPRRERILLPEPPPSWQTITRVRNISVKDLKGYVVKLDKFSKYVPVLKNSVAYKETPKERIFLMKDQATVEEAIEFGAEIYKCDVSFI